MKISVYVASNKPYWFPTDPMYRQIQVGRVFSEEPFCDLADDTGDNISDKNKTYCELTALYWLWRNDRTSDYLGLCHYRRYFAGKRFGKKEQRILSSEETERIFSRVPETVIVPKRRNYLWDTLYSHYANTHGASHLDITRSVIASDFPEWLDAYDETMSQHTAYMFNMFIMRRNKVEEYCSWLFSVLSKVEQQIDTSVMSAFDARVFGRISELLWNVWLKKTGYKVTQAGYVNLSRTRWFGKIRAYIRAKFFGKKLEQSY